MVKISVGSKLPSLAWGQGRIEVWSQGMKDSVPCAGPQEGPYEDTAPAQWPWEPEQHRDQQGTAMALRALSLWVSGVSPWAGNSRPRKEVIFCGGSLRNQGMLQPHPAISILIPITISMPIPSSMQSHQLRHPGKAVSPAHFKSSSFKQPLHGGTPPPRSHPHPHSLPARQAVSGWAVGSVFVPCLSPPHSFPG